MNLTCSSDRAFPGLCRKLCRKLADSTKAPTKLPTKFSQWPSAFTKPQESIINGLPGAHSPAAAEGHSETPYAVSYNGLRRTPLLAVRLAGNVQVRRFAKFCVVGSSGKKPAAGPPLSEEATANA